MNKDLDRLQLINYLIYKYEITGKLDAGYGTLPQLETEAEHLKNKLNKQLSQAKMWERLEGDLDTGFSYQEDRRNYEIVRKLNPVDLAYIMAEMVLTMKKNGFSFDEIEVSLQKKLKELIKVK